jgi:hypothetical protein
MQEVALVDRLDTEREALLTGGEDRLPLLLVARAERDGQELSCPASEAIVSQRSPSKSATA